MEAFGMCVGGGIPLLARWTSDWDCGYETSWWYCIKESPYDIESLSSSSRKNIRKAKKKCDVRKINPEDYENALWEVFSAAFERYKNATNHTKEESFKQGLRQQFEYEYWGGFDKETGKLIGYMICRPYSDYVETVVSKYDARYMNKRVSDALYDEILHHYLNIKGKHYACSGQRNINHETNVQKYQHDTFGYRNAYCHLNIIYRKPIGLVVNMLMPFRRVLEKFGNIAFIHNINAILRMEKIGRIQVNPVE